MRKLAVALLGLATAALVFQAPVETEAQARIRYRVTVYNLTRGQGMSPPVVATHTSDVAVFRAGHPASDGVRQVAEEGSPTLLQTTLAMNPDVMSIAVGGGVIPPGGAESFMVEARGRFNRLSIVSMLGSTNDAFMGLDGFDIDFDQLAARGGATVLVPAYDAGTETNNEDCANVLGPPCGASGSPDVSGAEGYVHVHAGIHGIGDLDPAMLDWRNPVAKVVITKLP